MFNWRVRANSGIFTQSMWIVCAPLVLFISLKHRTSKTKTRKESGNEVKTLPIGWWWITQSPHVFPFWRVGFSIFTTFMYLSKCAESQFYVCANGCYGLGGGVVLKSIAIFPLPSNKRIWTSFKESTIRPVYGSKIVHFTYMQVLFCFFLEIHISYFEKAIIFHSIQPFCKISNQNIFASYQTQSNICANGFGHHVRIQTHICIFNS